MAIDQRVCCAVQLGSVTFLATEPYATVRDRIEAARGAVGGGMQMDDEGGWIAVSYSPPLVEIAVLLRFEEDDPLVPSKAAVDPLSVSYVVAYVPD